MKIKAGIIGSAGYTGGELIRLLINHPEAELSLIHSKSNAANLYLLFTRTYWEKRISNSRMMVLL